MPAKPIQADPDSEMQPRELLLVVDVQNGFVNEKSGHVVTPIARLVADWLKNGRPVALTRFINDPGSQWERLIHWTRLRSSPEIDLHAELQAAIAGQSNVWVLDKRLYSSLTPELTQLLQQLRPSRVLVCGIATDGCVLKTAVDLFEAGYMPIVLEDLCASHAGREIHEAGLSLIRRFIGREQVVRSTESIGTTSSRD